MGEGRGGCERGGCCSTESMNPWSAPLRDDRWDCGREEAPNGVGRAAGSAAAGCNVRRAVAAGSAPWAGRAPARAPRPGTCWLASRSRSWKNCCRSSAHSGGGAVGRRQQRATGARCGRGVRAARCAALRCAWRERAPAPPLIGARPPHRAPGGPPRSWGRGWACGGGDLAWALAGGARGTLICRPRPLAPHRAVWDGHGECATARLAP
jgi:hypothetical protein